MMSASTNLPARAAPVSSIRMDPATTFRHLVPLSRLTAWKTPTEDVYVVAHMGIARVDAGTWQLTVDGMVERPFVLDHAGLTALPSRVVRAVIECYGNPVEPEVPTRRVGNVVWRGVPLAHVLNQSGLRPGVDSIWLEGLDHGTFANVHSDRYVKDIPVERALQDDVLLVWEMNGAPLTPEHGYPVRAFVPGFFGTNHVKWLSRVHAARGRPESLYTTRLYNRGVVVDGRPVSRPVRELDVHAVITSPADGAPLAGGAQEIVGWAWSAAPVVRVEVSTDGGATWIDAAVERRGDEPTWQRFSASWNARAGVCELQCRATDADGRTQPTHGRNRIHAVRVTIA